MCVGQQIGVYLYESSRDGHDHSDRCTHINRFASGSKSYRSWRRLRLPSGVDAEGMVKLPPQAMLQISRAKRRPHTATIEQWLRIRMIGIAFSAEMIRRLRRGVRDEAPPTYTVGDGDRSTGNRAV
jgi:hypothetical protein